jgi:hypothetical protein
MDGARRTVSDVRCRNSYSRRDVGAAAAPHCPEPEASWSCYIYTLHQCQQYEQIPSDHTRVGNFAFLGGLGCEIYKEIRLLKHNL